MSITRIIAAAAVASFAFAAPVAADNPDPETVSATFEDANPCTGAAQVVTIEFGLREHQHRNNSVLIARSMITTSEGHVGNVRETVVTTSNGILRSVLNEISIHPENGEMYSFKGPLRIDLNTGEVLIDELRTRCIREATT